MPFKPDPRFDSPEWRADLLLRQRSTKASVRRLAEETPGRSRSAIAEDLALARREEAIARRQAVSAAKARSEGGTVLAGLTPDGFALLQTPLGQTNYDPLMPDDVARARAYLRDDVERFLLDSGEDPLVASAAAEERAREWEPARGPR